VAHLQLVIDCHSSFREVRRGRIRSLRIIRETRETRFF
jgi:hypothetical protein